MTEAELRELRSSMGCQNCNHCPACGSDYGDKIEKLLDEVEALRAEAEVSRAHVGSSCFVAARWQQECGELRAEVEAQKRALDRWAHGVPIEGDYVCSEALENQRLRPVVDAARAWCENERRIVSESDAVISRGLNIVRSVRHHELLDAVDAYEKRERASDE